MAPTKAAPCQRVGLLATKPVPPPQFNRTSAMQEVLARCPSANDREWLERLLSLLGRLPERQREHFCYAFGFDEAGVGPRGIEQITKHLGLRSSSETVQGLKDIFSQLQQLGLPAVVDYPWLRNLLIHRLVEDSKTPNDPVDRSDRGLTVVNQPNGGNGSHLAALTAEVFERCAAASDRTCFERLLASLAKLPPELLAVFLYRYGLEDGSWYLRRAGQIVERFGFRNTNEAELRLDSCWTMLYNFELPRSINEAWLLAALRRLTDDCRHSTAGVGAAAPPAIPPTAPSAVSTEMQPVIDRIKNEPDRLTVAQIVELLPQLPSLKQELFSFCFGFDRGGRPRNNSEAVTKFNLKRLEYVSMALKPIWDSLYGLGVSREANGYWLRRVLRQLHAPDDRISLPAAPATTDDQHPAAGLPGDNPSPPASPNQETRLPPLPTNRLRRDRGKGPIGSRPDVAAALQHEEALRSFWLAVPKILTRRELTVLQMYYQRKMSVSSMAQSFSVELEAMWTEVRAVKAKLGITEG